MITAPGHILLSVIDGLLFVLQDSGDAWQLCHQFWVSLPQRLRHHPGQLPQATVSPSEAKLFAADGEGALDDVVEIVATE